MAVRAVLMMMVVVVVVVEQRVRSGAGGLPNEL